MNSELQKIYESVKKKVTFKPEAALILGSGLGNFAETIRVVETLEYKILRAFPCPQFQDIKEDLFSDMWRMCPWLSCRDESITMRAIP